jgi:hypothetical protein
MRWLRRRRASAATPREVAHEWLWELARTPCADRIHYEMLMRLL